MAGNTVSLKFGVDNSGAVTGLKEIGQGFEKLADKAKLEGGKIATGFDKGWSRVKAGFSSVSNGIVNGLGNLTETLAQGGGVGPALFTFGAYMAGQAAEAFLETMIERLAESSLIAAIGAPISAAFSALGAFISTAISVGMAAFPVILVGVLIAAIAFLIANPDIVNKIGEFAMSVLKAIGDGLASLGKLLVDLFGAAWQLVVNGVGLYIQTVANFWLGLPGLIGDLLRTIPGFFGKVFNAVSDVIRTVVGHIVEIILGIVKAVRDAISWIDKLIPKVNGISALPPIPGLPLPHFAEGGIVPGGLNQPQLIVAHGGEQVIPVGGRSGGSSGFTIQGVSRADMERIVDQQLFVLIRRAAPGTS